MFGRVKAVPILVPLFFAIAISAESNFWLFPGRAGDSNDYSLDPIFPLSSTQRLQWNTDFDTYNLTLWQQSSPGGAATSGAIIYAKSSSDSEVGGFEWNVQTYSLKLEDSPVFFIWVLDPEGNSFTSHYFNITAKGVSSSITASATSTATSTSASTSDASARSVTATQSVPVQTLSAPTQSPQPQNNNSAFKVGLGVGLGLGIPLVLLLGVYLGMKAMKTRRTLGQPTDLPIYVGSDPPKYPLEEFSQAPSGELLHTEPVELPGHGYYSPRELL
ncbi:hypothetical protein BU16DRAFT_527754 [Lophium mytilinum]|uniref:Mid2 domain-containing protein n=1 Tax=Lophium mytilinum TaxID=390894 RepID=A0A6A6QQK7_9PEZI|nr:hypothetical protein BU16DRAFT_527754 [Lophium mytilinum]